MSHSIIIAGKNRFSKCISRSIVTIAASKQNERKNGIECAKNRCILWIMTIRCMTHKHPRALKRTNKIALFFFAFVHFKMVQRIFWGILLLLLANSAISMYACLWNEYYDIAAVKVVFKCLQDSNPTFSTIYAQKKTIYLPSTSNHLIAFMRTNDKNNQNNNNQKRRRITIKHGTIYCDWFTVHLIFRKLIDYPDIKNVAQRSI